jgi:hypothetical protein
LKTVPNLLQRLKLHESRHEDWKEEQKNQGGSTEEKAFLGQKLRYGNNGNKDTGKCHNCGNIWHIKANCRGQEKKPA